jgi:mono/diheme cytochrome c family protein
MKRGSFLSGILGGVIISVLVGLLLLPMIGVFDMTATGENNILDWWGNKNLQSTLKRRAPETKIPDAADPSRGFDHYKSTCLHCHGSPDAQRESWANNMLPMPPHLQKADTQNMSDGALFYIISNGIRMTGMPAFIPDHSEEDIWDIVAVVRGLNNLTEPQKQELQKIAALYGHGGRRHGGGEKDAGSENGQHSH